ncbi:MAG: exodeoxyribonuclease VII large subunit [Coprococcus sp.]
MQDIINVSLRRNPWLQIVFCPAAVQGDGAAQSIVRESMRWKQPAWMMIVGRGGGSIEDLWAFNEEIVARAVYECSVPVISAVGHETDTTIIDFVSDLRAPTPSAAAELAVEHGVILGQIQGYEESLSHAMEQAVLRNRQRVENYQRIFRHLNPQSRLNDRRQRLMEIEERLRIGMNRKLDAAKSELAIRTQKLEGVSPLRQLERGYAYVSDEEGHGITSAGQVTKGQLLLLDVRDGRIESKVTAVKKRTS